MYLCVCAISRALRVLPALASHVQRLGFLTMPTEQDSMSEPWGQQPLPQWSQSIRTALPQEQIWAQSLPIQGWGCPHPSWLPCSWLGQQGSPWIPHPTWMYSREPLLGQHPAPGHCQPLSCPAAFCMVGVHHPVLHRQSHLACP